MLDGRRQPAPTERRLPRWLRLTLRQGLAHNPDDRPQSMDALISALQYETRARRRRGVAIVALGLVAAVVAGAVSMTRSPLAACHRRAHQLDAVWTADAKERVRAAFAGSGLPFAADSFRTVASFLDRYVAAFSAAYGDACDAAHRDGRQSVDARDLRLACLEDRATSFTQLGTSLAGADAATVTEAASGAAKLEPIAACAELALLAAPLPPPAEPTTRARIRQLRRRLAEANGLELAAKYDDAKRISDEVLAGAKALGFAPLEAEAWFASVRSTTIAAAGPTPRRATPTPSMPPSAGGPTRSGCAP